MGEHALAAFVAMREVEIRLRDLAEASDDDVGVKLARFALNPETGRLAIPSRRQGSGPR